MAPPRRPGVDPVTPSWPVRSGPQADRHGTCAAPAPVDPRLQGYRADRPRLASWPRRYSRPHRTKNVPPAGVRDVSRKASPCRSTGLPIIAAAHRMIGPKNASTSSSCTKVRGVGATVVPVRRSSCDPAKATNMLARSQTGVHSKTSSLPQRRPLVFTPNGRLTGFSSRTWPEPVL